MTSHIGEIIAGGIRAQRAKLHVNQKEVAEAIEVNQATVSAWENRGCITLENAWKLADYYGISIDELAGRK